MRIKKAQKKKTLGRLLAWTCLLALLWAGIPLFGKTIAVKGGEIHTMEGEVINPGTILIQEGKIVEIGRDVQVPEDAEILEASGYILYPGFMAPSGFFGAVELKNFESFTPDASALDRFDFLGDYSLYLKGGVTTAYVAMPSDRIISGRGAIVRLSPGGTDSAVLKAEVSLCVSLEKEAVLPPMTDIFPAPVSAENPLVPSLKQYPSSNLGAFWLLNELFRFDVYSGDLARYFQNISDSLKQAREQGLPLLIRCQDVSSIRQAVLLSQTLGMRLIIQGGAEASLLADLIKEKDVSIIAEADVRPNGIWPDEDSGSEDKDWRNLQNIVSLIQQGIPVAITAVDEKYLPELFWVTQYFQKFGIGQEELIKTITINPAKIFGLEDRIGSLAKGKDADILFFKKETGLPLPQLQKVMSEGRMVYEKK
jgi:hypothetical protein